MKMTLHWHRECLKNARDNLAREEKTVSRQIAHLEDFRLRVAHYENQINTAIEKELDGFDTEKFLNKRNTSK